MKIRGFRLLILLSTLAGFLSTGRAQRGTFVTVQDLETWSSVSLSYKPVKAFSVGLRQELRLKDNSTTMDVYFTELEMKYRFKSGFSLAAAGRFLRENDDAGKVRGIENHFRWNADAMYKHSLGRFKLKYRLRYQTRNELQVVGAMPTNKLRLQAGGTYNIKNWKLDPQLSVEIFRETSDPLWEKIRVTLGTSYEFKSFGDLGVFYRLENELVGAYPKRTYILGLQYMYTLKSY
jgi:hypothetical protein